MTTTPADMNTTSGAGGKFPSFRESEATRADRLRRDGRLFPEIDKHDCKFFDWKQPDQMKPKEPNRKFMVTSGTTLLSLHLGPGLTADDVLALEFPEAPLEGDQAENGEFILWDEDSRVVAIIEWHPNLGCRVTRIKRQSS